MQMLLPMHITDNAMFQFVHDVLKHTETYLPCKSVWTKVSSTILYKSIVVTACLWQDKSHTSLTQQIVVMVSNK